ncbi:hypothetical protein like AT5G54630 [Hibiscus trionum]|uniref:C2H2-type domain-containing protein n=1 Tax=Hibiscus trionum TaxID=183268 RepID=A0A9W7MVH9_HIBTR|nr:hypothetical protein like AT5G54630 [Hibiscus trionum]
MPLTWLISLKKSVNCKPELSDVREPEDRTETTRNKCLCCSCCSRSPSSLRDVSHGSKRHTDKAPIGSGSPISIASTEILNPITHQTVFTDSKCVLEIKTRGSRKGSSTFVGTLSPGTPGPGGDRFMEAAYTYSGSRSRGPSNLGSGRDISSKHRRSLDLGSHGYVCQKCGEHFTKLEAIESHHLSRHAVTALCEGDSSKKIVELICQTGFSHSENEFGEMERILKIHNMQKTLASFEDYREMVKLKANKLSKKHPRCLADGNELLRFYGTTIACSLGMENTPNLCTLEKCGVCQILRHGFFSKKQPNGSWGVFTSSTSKRAMDCIEIDEGNKALVVCRVIAGRVLKPLESLQGMEAQPNFDSLAGKADCHSNIEELYSLNPRALLPCFVVVICKK